MENTNATERFTTPAEEIAYLRGKLSSFEKTGASLEREERKEILRHEIKQYQSVPATKVIPENRVLAPSAREKIVLDLAPEKHDTKMQELFLLLSEKGLKNALSVLEALKNPHLDDDFHRVLVQYLISGIDPTDFKKSKEIFKAAHLKLYEVTLPDFDPREKEKEFRELVSLMERFYAGMLALSDGKDNEPARNYFTLEIALPNNGDEISMYVAVPREHGDIFEKQIFGLYPKAKIEERRDDYNIFNDDGASYAMVGKLKTTPALPIKTYESFSADPISVILNTFSKLKREGEGVAIQFVCLPAGEKFIKRYGAVLDDVKRGMSVSQAAEHADPLLSAVRSTYSFFAGTGKNKESDHVVKHVDEEAIKLISEKIGSTIMNVNIRAIASAESSERARAILRDLASAFHQFTETKGNTLLFEEARAKESLKIFHKFSYRLWDDDEALPLNVRELTTLFHFPVQVEGFSQLRHARAGTSPPPLEIPHAGTLLGVNKYRHQETKVFMGKEDRVRHFYVIGQTGTGKTTILKNMIVQDIREGNGCCFIDPHGSDVQDILSLIPDERVDDVIYFDPSYAERPMALNMLEFDERHPEQKTFVVDEILGIFNKLFDMKTAGGPAFEQYFRNSAMLVMDHPESGNTLLEISRVLSDKSFRELKMMNCKNPLVLQFWQNALKTTGEQSLANYAQYVTNKFDVFLSNEIMRPIVAQQKSAFNFREVMDNKKILLVNLAKGRLGDINANLIGLILVGKISMAALSRVDLFGKPMNDFYLYIDEFQNVTTPAISSILSEARKYRLSLNIAHQYITQLEENIKNAVFGNVGSMAIFRVGADDAEFLSKQVEPTFSASDILKLENRNAYLRLLVNGTPVKPFNIETLAPEKGDTRVAEHIKELSYLKYGRARQEVESEILAKYQVLKI